MVIIGAGASHSTIFGTVPNISVQIVHVLHLVAKPNDSITFGAWKSFLPPDTRFDPENPRPSDGTKFSAVQRYETDCLVPVTEPI